MTEERRTDIQGEVQQRRRVQDNRSMEERRRPRENRSVEERRRPRENGSMEERRRPHENRSRGARRNPEYVRRRKQIRRRKRIRRRIILTILVLACIAGGVGVYLSYDGRVYSQCVFEAGVEVKAEDFLKDTSKEVAFSKDSRKIDTKVPGEYTVELESGIFSYECMATIQDTISPTAQAVDVYFEIGQTVEPQQFVTKVADATKTKIAYVNEPDYKKPGKQKVEVSVTDEGKNKIVLQAYLISRATKAELTLEAGDDFPKLKKFLLSEDVEASFVTDTDKIDTKKVTDHAIEISVEEEKYTTILHIKDTVKPVLETKDITTFKNDKVSCEDFIESTDDVTELTYAFVKEPNMQALGEQKVTIKATDAGGNSTEKEAALNVVEDTKAPTIKGAEDFSVTIGESISYKSGVSVKDDYDKDVKLDIDSSKVDVNKVGTYPVTYSAKDASGNESKVTIQVTIKEKEYNEAKVNKMADELLGQILKPNMKEYNKLVAIYNWMHRQMSYVNTSEKGDWIRSAYEGLKYKKGDCYVYASTAKALLTRAGIKNMDIEKIPDKQRHYWNLVDIGEGWYHFDATPRNMEKIHFCYVTDKKIMDYSNANGNTHNYDKSKYPKIN